VDDTRVDAVLSSNAVRTLVYEPNDTALGNELQTWCVRQEAMDPRVSTPADPRRIAICSLYEMPLAGQNYHRPQEKSTFRK
jgi:hypothetical protein